MSSYAFSEHGMTGFDPLRPAVAAGWPDTIGSSYVSCMTAGTPSQGSVRCLTAVGSRSRKRSTFNDVTRLLHTFAILYRKRPDIARAKVLLGQVEQCPAKRRQLGRTNQFYFYWSISCDLTRTYKNRKFAYFSAAKT